MNASKRAAIVVVLTEYLRKYGEKQQIDRKSEAICRWCGEVRKQNGG